MSAARTAILLDPHPLWLDAVQRVLEGVGVEVRGKATRPDLARKLVAEHNPDLSSPSWSPAKAGWRQPTRFARYASEPRAFE